MSLGRGRGGAQHEDADEHEHTVKHTNAQPVPHGVIASVD
jgi:hypothetical protein